MGFMDEDDVTMETHKIPSEADFLIAYSVVPGKADSCGYNI